MRAFIDAALITCWLIVLGAVQIWFILTALPEAQPYAEQCGRLAFVLFPLVSAVRVHQNYEIARPGQWCIGLWFFSWAVVASHGNIKPEAFYQTTLMLASLLYIALPLPLQRVWEILRLSLRRGERK